MTKNMLQEQKTFSLKTSDLKRRMGHVIPLSVENIPESHSVPVDHCQFQQQIMTRMLKIIRLHKNATQRDYTPKFLLDPISNWVLDSEVDDLTIS